MEATWITAVAQALEADRHVPMPGGHGQLHCNERDALPAYRDAPGVAPRCAVVLGVMGDIASLSVVEQMVLLGDWHLRVLDWFVCRPRLNMLPIAIPDKPRVMLRAMASLVESWAARQTVHPPPMAEQAVARAHECCDRACRRPFLNAQPSELMPWHGQALAAWSAEPAQWETARRELSGAWPGHALTLLFLHLLHARLGLHQPSPDDMRVPPVGYAFYARLESFLTEIRCDDELRHLAEDIAAVLRQTALLRGMDRTLSMKRFIERLPGCFKPYQRGPLPHLGFVGAMMGNVEPARLLAGTARLATLVADALIDPLHVRPGPDTPAFGSRSYVWPALRANRGAFTLLLEMFRDERLPALVHRHLAGTCRSHWADHAAQARPCALTHIETL